MNRFAELAEKLIAAETERDRKQALAGLKETETDAPVLLARAPRHLLQLVDERAAARRKSGALS